MIMVYMWCVCMGYLGKGNFSQEAAFIRLACEHVYEIFFW